MPQVARVSDADEGMWGERREMGAPGSFLERSSETCRVRCLPKAVAEGIRLRMARYDFDMMAGLIQYGGCVLMEVVSIARVRKIPFRCGGLSRYQLFSMCQHRS